MSSEMQEDDGPSAKRIKLEKSTDFRVWPIIHPKYRKTTVPLTFYHALQLEDKTIIGEIIDKLPPIKPDLSHLKRVGKDGWILIDRGLEEAQFFLKYFEDPRLKIEDLKEVQVPWNKPITRAQFDFAKEHWPTSFHPDEKIEKLLDGSFVTDELRDYIFRWMYETVDNIKGCAVVKDGELKYKGSCAPERLGHAVMEMVGSLPIHHPTVKMADYIGTGADVFLVNEPCSLCAMALVHFRIDRVFFAYNSRNGVLKENGWQLHLERKLNHNYEVYRVEIPDEEVSTDPARPSSPRECTYLKPAR